MHPPQHRDEVPEGLALGDVFRFREGGNFLYKVTHILIHKEKGTLHVKGPQHKHDYGSEIVEVRPWLLEYIKENPVPAEETPAAEELDKRVSKATER